MKLKFLIGFVAVLLFVEMGIRFLVTVPPTPSGLRAQSLSYEPVVFARHALSREARRVINFYAPESVFFPINLRGYRGPVFAVPKLPETIRVVVYGGSSVFDLNNASSMIGPIVLRNFCGSEGIPRSK